MLSAGLTQLTPRTMTAAGLLDKQLDTIVETGVAYEFEESAVGLVCVASAVLGRDDDVLTAVNVSGPITRSVHSSTPHRRTRQPQGIAATLARRQAFREQAQ